MELCNFKQHHRFLALVVLFFFMLNGFAQTVEIRTVTGIITSTNGDPLIGATIKVKGTNTGSTTDIDGQYTIRIPETDNTIFVISYLGYESQELAISNEKKVDVELKESSALLDELVVIGYATKKKTDVVGAISSINTESFNQGIINTPEQLLQAKVPGVRVTSSSGEPGAGVNLTIRGAGSLRSGNSPLYVVDGVPLSNVPITPPSSNLSGADVPTVASSKNPLNFLNPDDIASIDVLKDASATAIYGSRGSNGVVIITTKKGKPGDASLNYNGYVGSSSISKKIDVVGLDSGTDWQEEILRDGGALTHNHNLSYSGGSQRASYRTSLSYFDQKGIIDKSALRRFTARLNTTLFALPGDRLRLDLNLVNSNVIDNGIPRADKSDTTGELITNTLAADPSRPIFGSDGNYSPGSTNPVGLLDAWNDITNTNRTLGNLSARLDIIEGLNYQFNLGIDRSGATREQELQPNNLEGINFNKGSYTFANIDANNRLIENFLTYNTFVNDNQFEFLIGHAYQRNEVNSFAYSARGGIEFPTISALDAPSFPQTEIPDSREPSGHEISKLESIFGRVNYTWNEKLLVTASMRADGSSKFGANNRWGYFPAFSAAYRLADLVDGFDDLKLRIGWGQTGNQEIPNKATQKTFIPVTNSIKPTREANPDLKWEVSTQINVGANFALENEHLYGSIDYFNRVTTDPLLFVDAAAPTVSKIWKNLNGEIKNQGVELFLGSAIINQSNFSWNVDVNATFTSNEVSFPDGREIFTGELSGKSINGTLTQLIKDGESLGSFFLPEDMGDGSTTDGSVINGSGIPNFVYGINTYLNYDKFDLGMNFSGVSGNLIYNATDNFLSNFGGNVSERINAQADIPVGASSFFLEDGSFLRLNNLTLGYTFGTATTDWLSNARLYVTGQNLFVLTDYSGYDPEVNTPSAVNGILSYGIDYATYPRARTFLVGVSLGF